MATLNYQRVNHVVFLGTMISFHRVPSKHHRSENPPATSSVDKFRRQTVKLWLAAGRQWRETEAISRPSAHRIAWISSGIGILSDSMEVGAKIPWNGSMFTARSEGFPVIFIPEVLRFWGVLVLRIKLLVILSKSRSLRFVSNLSLPRIYWIIQNSKSQTESHVISRFFPGGLKNHM